MAKSREEVKQENKQKADIGEANHILRLFKTIASKIGDSFLNAEQRGIVKEYFGHFDKVLGDMEQSDEEFQNLPENKIKRLQEELKHNDTILKKNKDDLRMQVQLRLFQLGYPKGNPMYDSLLDKMRLDVEEARIMLDTEMKVIHPEYEFQTIPRWLNIQKEKQQKHLKALGDNIKDIEGNVEKVKQEIELQTERMTQRKAQIIEELEKLGVKITDEKPTPPDYVG